MGDRTPAMRTGLTVVGYAEQPCKTRRTARLQPAGAETVAHRRTHAFRGQYGAAVKVSGLHFHNGKNGLDFMGSKPGR